MNEHLKGHKSLAEMVSTHIEVWRDALKLKRDELRMPSARQYHDALSHVEHELRALNDIEKACEKEMGQ